jgi:hypothetical protein
MQISEGDSAEMSALGIDSVFDLPPPPVGEYQKANPIL